MKIIICFLLSFYICIGQPISYRYYALVSKADSFYQLKDYKRSAVIYSLAFKENNGKVYFFHRYKAACAWSLSHEADSAFSHLNHLSASLKFTDYSFVKSDPALSFLHNDERWQIFIERIRQNKSKVEVHYNKFLISILGKISVDDQKYRSQIDSIEKLGRGNSDEIIELTKLMINQDIINRLKVQIIIEKYGWLGTDIIGEEGSSTLFLVIQHSPEDFQKKYFPIMQNAVKDGKASASALALLEDRILLSQGKKQKYGSQVGRNNETGKYYILPIEDSVNVNFRRMSVGLEPIEQYLKFWIEESTLQNNSHTVSVVDLNTINNCIYLFLVLFIVSTVFLYKRNKFTKWYWCFVFVFVIYFIELYFDYNSVHSLVKQYNINWLLFGLSRSILKYLVFFIISKGLTAIFNKIIISDVISIFCSYCICFYISIFLQKIFIPTSGLTFLISITEPLFYSSVYLITNFILYLVKKKAQRIK